MTRYRTDCRRLIVMGGRRYCAGPLFTSTRPSVPPEELWRGCPAWCPDYAAIGGESPPDDTGDKSPFADTP